MLRNRQILFIAGAACVLLLSMAAIIGRNTIRIAEMRLDISSVKSEADENKQAILNIESWRKLTQSSRFTRESGDLMQGEINKLRARVEMLEQKVIK